MTISDIDETFGKAVDRLENLIVSLTAMKTLPDHIHVEVLREALPEVLEDIKVGYEFYCEGFE